MHKKHHQARWPDGVMELNGGCYGVPTYDVSLPKKGLLHADEEVVLLALLCKDVLAGNEIV